MGYTLTMFGVLLVMSVIMVTAVNYGIAKDSTVAPLRAENNYAERETGKAQTDIIINNTCLTPDTSFERYTKASGSETLSGPYILHLTVKNNGSIILNPNNVTVLYNKSYSSSNVSNWKAKQTEIEEICEDFDNGYFNSWPPKTYVCINALDIWIATPGDVGHDDPQPNPEIMLLAAAENGISIIAPTTPTNFTGKRDSDNRSYVLNWNPSYDEDGIAYYRLYAIDNNNRGKCPPDMSSGDNSIKEIPGNITSSTYYYEVDCDGCTTIHFYVKAVDNLGNEGVQTRTIRCQKSQDKPCDY